MEPLTDPPPTFIWMMIHHRVFLTNAVGRDAGSQNCFVILTTTIYARSLYLEHGLIIVTYRASAEQRMKKKIYKQDRKELILIRRSFIRFVVVVVKRQEEERKNPFVASFQAKKSSHFEWMDTSTRPSLREEMRNKKRKMESIFTFIPFSL